jgi:hypothetical protein
LLCAQKARAQICAYASYLPRRHASHEQVCLVPVTKQMSLCMNSEPKKTPA